MTVRAPLLPLLLCLALLLSPLCHAEEASVEPMQGVPPTSETQVTMKNYRDYPMGRWAFRNAGAPLNVVMIPRQGEIHPLPGPLRPELGDREFTDLHGRKLTFDALFEANYADGVVIVQGSRLLHERYFHGFNPHAQHIWFSMTKSLASAAFGLLVAEGKVDLQASPANYIPELKGSGFERVTIQQVLDHATAIDFKENYTDFNSDFFRFYAPALNLAWLPGAADVQPGDTEIYGVHDFLARFIKPDTTLQPGEAFDYNSSNADLLGWLIARISGQSFQDYVQQHIWSRLGAEHDAFIAVDRAYMPVVTGGMNTTLRDAARFGMMIRDRGQVRGEQIIPTDWVDATLQIDDQLRANMAANPKYSDDPWLAYHNMWWVLDDEAGEYCAVGVHGQVIYINRRADTVMAWFSSQPGASAARNPDFHSKLQAARKLATSLIRKPVAG
ncbi:MAG: beta-lactamase family protein [Gammaproteobacteria bacterium]|nr:beta-lactamase family protein [Gammaproteobacteria bacterium]